MTLAKALGDGVPVGAMLATETIAAERLDAGAHGSTFGGNCADLRRRASRRSRR